jgi:hypothetical protein
MAALIRDQGVELDLSASSVPGVLDADNLGRELLDAAPFGVGAVLELVEVLFSTRFPLGARVHGCHRLRKMPRIS